MKICRNCGHEMNDDELFCCECGTKAEAQETAAEVTQETEGEKDEETEAIEKALDAAVEEEQTTAEEETLIADQTGAEEEYVTAKLDEPIFCPNCGMKNEADGMFCQNCGAPLNEINTADAAVPLQPEAVPTADQAQPEEPAVSEPAQAVPIYCPACGTLNDASDAFCQSCGANLHESAQMPQEIPAPVKKKSKLPVIIGGIAAVAVVVGAAAFGISRFGGGKGANPDIKYVKDTGIYQYNIKANKALEFTSKGVEKNAPYYVLYSALSGIQETKDGKYEFFYENYDGSTGKLCYIDKKKQSDKNDTTEKIDNDVTSFQVTDDNRVIYMKRGTDTLYIYDLKSDEKEKVGSDIYTYMLSEDGKVMLYLTDDMDMYYRETKIDADKEKLDSDVYYSYYYTKDLNTIYYTKDTDIYCMKNLKDKEKVASDATLLGSYNDNAGIYYTKTSDEAITVKDIVDDDMAAADAAMSEPLKYNYTKQEQNWYGRTEYVTDYDAYNAAMEAYREKESRDEIREALKDETSFYMGEFLDIYAYDGTEHELLKNASSPEDIGISDWIYYTYCWDDVELPTVKLSELESAYDVSSVVFEAVDKLAEDGMDGYLLTDGKAVPFAYESDVEYTADGDSKTIYGTRYTFDEDTYNTTYEELFSMKYSDSGVEKPVTIDDDLGENYSSQYPESGKMYYYKDYDNSKGQGTLYCDGEEIDDDVYVYYYDEDTQNLYYLKEKSKSASGTLCRYDGGKPVKLMDDVSFFSVADNQYVAVLVDYSNKRLKGDLKLISQKDGKKTKKIDEDVRWLLNGTGSYDMFY